MKKILLIFSGIFAFGIVSPVMAVTITKAAPVVQKQTSATSGATSLMPTVLGLVSQVQALNQKNKELSAECIPSRAEIDFVNNLVKEWAKTGSMSADAAVNNLKMPRCENGADGGYARAIELYGPDETDVICTDYFNDSNAVWYNYPKAAMAQYCVDGAETCTGSKRKTVSNIYNVFALIDFSTDDLTTAEGTKYAKLTDKIEKCSDAKISAARRLMWGEFLTNTLSTVGAPTNTGSIMDAVKSVSSGGLGGGMNSISGIATQFLNQ